MKQPARSPYLRSADELSEIVEELKYIKNMPIAPPPDVGAVERKLQEHLEGILPRGVDAATGHIFDELIDSYLAEWSAAGFRHHSSVLVDLDILAAKVDAHLAGHTELAVSDQMRAYSSAVAVESAMLRMADDDLPTVNPVRAQSAPHTGRAQPSPASVRAPSNPGA